MKTHGTEVFAVFNKRSSAFALYEGIGGEGFLPYQTYPKFRSREMDKKFITGLRKWFVDFQIDEGTRHTALIVIIFFFYRIWKNAYISLFKLIPSSFPSALDMIQILIQSFKLKHTL